MLFWSVSELRRNFGRGFVYFCVLGRFCLSGVVVVGWVGGRVGVYRVDKVFCV